MLIGRRAFCGGLLAASLLPGAGRARAETGLLPRQAWGARPALPGGRPHQAVRFGLHHSAGPWADSAGAPALLRAIQRVHMEERGWPDIAYHAFVDGQGQAWEGRDLGLCGDTATAYDPEGWLLVCALGNFEERALPPAQLEGLARLLAALHRAHAIPLEGMSPHRALATTLCPGAALLAHLDDGSLLARARALAAP